MKSEIWLDLCFIREGDELAWFVAEVEEVLQQLFAEPIVWELEAKREGKLEVVNAAVNGYSDWQLEQEILVFLEQQAPAVFWEWLQAYRLELDLKRPEECLHCKEKAAGVGV